MSFLDWFRPKNKHNVVLPTIDPSKLLHGLELLKEFTTDTEPKIADFPKQEYKVYWETCLDTVQGGYQALVRFYGFDSNGVVQEHKLTNNNLSVLKDEVNRLIHTTMNKYQR